MFGISLEFGAWNLELKSARGFPNRQQRSGPNYSGFPADTSIQRSGVLISLNSHARAYAHQRFAVDSEMPRTSAASSIFRPTK